MVDIYCIQLKRPSASNNNPTLKTKTPNSGSNKTSNAYVVAKAKASAIAALSKVSAKLLTKTRKNNKEMKLNKKEEAQ